MSLAILFSPQGSQVVGMGRDLAEADSDAAAIFATADATLGWSVSGLAWDGPQQRLDDTRQTQPCLITASLAAFAALRSAMAAHGGLRPALVAGHSVGEFAALVAAGVLSFPDAVRLASLRGSLMADAGVDGGMVAVIGLERRVVAELVSASSHAGELTLANHNAPGQVVISGTQAALAVMAGPLTAAGARRSIPLRVSGPFHSPQMAPIGARLAEAFAGVDWRDADPPLVSNVTAEPVQAAAEIRVLLAQQVSSPVEWVRSVERMVAAGVDTFVECGPGGALAGMVRRIAPSARALTVSDTASLRTTVDLLASALVGSGA